MGKKNFLKEQTKKDSFYWDKLQGLETKFRNQTIDCYSDSQSRKLISGVVLLYTMSEYKLLVKD